MKKIKIQDPDQLDNVWFTSDTHFGHGAIIKYSNRPFLPEWYVDFHTELYEKVHDFVPPSHGPMYDRMRKYKPSSDEILAHDTAIINNWNSKIKKNDIVFHLGDFCFGNTQDACDYLDMLNGKIYFVCGNHDDPVQKCKQRFQEFEDIIELSVNDPEPFTPLSQPKRNNTQKIVLCHYSMQTWNGAVHNAYHAFGHSHGNLKGKGLSCDVGVDAVAQRNAESVGRTKTIPTDYGPISYKEFVDTLREQNNYMPQS